MCEHSYRSDDYNIAWLIVANDEKLSTLFFTEADSTCDSRKSGSNVAIVDDNDEICSVISKMVQHFGWGAPAILHDGKEIVEAIESRKLSPDVIIMDYCLPHMNGLEASRIISRKFPAIKIIVATSDESVRAQVASEGFGFLKKPFGFKTLMKSVFSRDE